MKLHLPLTQRDFVALVIYAVLAYNLFSSLLNFLSHLVLPRFVWFQSSIGGPSWEYYAIDLGDEVVFVLALLPFVSLIARSVTGRQAARVVGQSHLLTLALQGLGVVLFVMALSTLVSDIIEPVRFAFFSGRTFSTTNPYYPQNLVSALVTGGAGVVLAFAPSLFVSVRALKQNEETAA